ncbi:type I restriction enzyme, S subunit [Desulfonatronum zhilinae]|nr:type I restriction enzyme, S subunit [Desulfonatronum zhilinae]
MMRDDWVEVELGSVFPIKYGKGLPTKVLLDRGFPVFGANGIIGYYTEYKYEDEQILISCRGAASGTINISPKKCFVTNNSLIVEIPEKVKVERKFLFYALKSANKSKIITGSAQPQVTINNANTLKILIAPLSEQRAIVAKIEKLLSELDNGIANFKNAKAKLEIFRQAVLKKAFEGELTNRWREKKSVSISEWNYIKLGNILLTIDGDRGKNYPKKHNFLNSGYCLFLSTKNVRKGKFIFDENIFITKDKDQQLGSGKLKRNDVVITTRGTLGNVALYDDNIKYENIRINSGMLILRVNDPKELSPHYLMQFINSPAFFYQLKKKQSGTAQPQIPANVFREILINLPNSIEEQFQIIMEIESRLSVCDKMTEIIDQSLEKAEALRQSILKKAFEGKLLSEDEVAACRREADWEPAQTLLERIRKDKAGGGNRARTRKKRST